MKLGAEIEMMNITSQGTPRIAANHQKRKAKRKETSLELAEKAWPCQHLDFRLLISRTVKEYIYFILSHPVCGTFITATLRN